MPLFEVAIVENPRGRPLTLLSWLERRWLASISRGWMCWSALSCPAGANRRTA